MPRIVTVTAWLAVLCAFLAPMARWLGSPLALAAVILAIWSLVVYIRWRRDSKYDLSALRELHETGGPPPTDDLPEIPDDAGVVCPCCGTVYGAWMLICPQCKR